MDQRYGAGWRDSEASEPMFVMTDTEDRAKIRIYPRVDTVAHVGTTTLLIEYSYIPTDMDGTVTNCPLPDLYAPAAVEFAVSACLEDAVQSKQNPLLGDRAARQFERMVLAARSEVNRGLFGEPDPHVILRPFV